MRSHRTPDSPERPFAGTQTEYLLRMLNSKQPKQLAEVLLKFCLGFDHKTEETPRFEEISALLKESGMTPHEQHIFIQTILMRKQYKAFAAEMHMIPQQVADNLNRSLTKLYQYAGKLAVQGKGHIE